jgi:hypothetical protein
MKKTKKSMVNIDLLGERWCRKFLEIDLNFESYGLAEISEI